MNLLSRFMFAVILANIYSFVNKDRGAFSVVFPLGQVFYIVGCGVIQHLAGLVKAGAVAGAVPGMFSPVPPQGAAQVGTAGRGRTQEIRDAFCTVAQKLLVKDTALGRE